ncbi:hypothetical protein ACEPAG_5132 [Sanghuangporus baumii]
MPPTSPSQTAIFWDFENCRPSSNISGNKVVYNIRRLVQGYGSITTFRAYIDLSVDCAYSRSISFHSDLQSSGLSLVHCPHNGKKDVADKMMIVDMLAFAIDRPAPACIVLITGDRDFAYAAAILKLRGYRIIVISPASNAHTSLKVQADNLYDWQTDVLDPMDFVVDSGSQRSETLVTSAPKPSGTPVSVASTSPVCLIHDYPDTTNRIGPLRNEVLSITRPRSVSGNTLHGYTISSVPDLTHIRLETPQDTSAGCMERRQVEQGGIKADSTRSSYQLSNRALYKLFIDASHTSQLSRAIVSGSEKGTFVLPKGPSGKVKLVPKAKPDAPKELNKAKKKNKKATKTTKAAPKKSVANKKTLATSAKQNKKVSVAKAPGGKGPAPNKPVEKAQSKTLSKKPNLRPAKKPTVPSKKATSAKTKPAAKKSSSKKSGVKKAAAKTAASKPKKPVSKGKQSSKRAASSKKPTSTKSTKPASQAEKASPKKIHNRRRVLLPRLLSRSSRVPQASQPAAQWVYAPLTSRLRAEIPSHRLLYSALGMFFRAQHPDLYKRANVSGLSSYLEKAEKNGVIRIGSGDSPGSEWAELMPAFRGIVHHGSNS